MEVQCTASDDSCFVCSCNCARTAVERRLGKRRSAKSSARSGRRSKFTMKLGQRRTGTWRKNKNNKNTDRAGRKHKMSGWKMRKRTELG